MLVFYCPVTSEFDAILPNISKSIERSLWLRPSVEWFTRDDLNTILEAFAVNGFKGIVWYSTSGRSGNSSAIAEHKRSFGYWPHLVSDVIEQVTIDSLPTQGRIYSDVGWLSEDAAEPLTRFLSQPAHLVGRAALAFVTHRAETGHNWASIIDSLRWLDRCRKWIGTPPVPLFDYAAVTLDYIRLTGHIGGVPGLIWAGVDVRGGIVVFGKQHILDDLWRALDGHVENMQPGEFYQSLRRGITLSGVP